MEALELDVNYLFKHISIFYYTPLTQSTTLDIFESILLSVERQNTVFAKCSTHHSQSNGMGIVIHIQFQIFSKLCD